VSVTETGDLWWKTAIVYCLDVKTFLDWNGDGVGDFAGVTERLDYLAGLGVTCLWLMPFYPAGGTDDGYDVVDYFGVDTRLGDLGDFVELVRTARDRGIRIIIDLVIQHTSDKHPWFQAALKSKQSPFRDYYLWRAKPPAKAAGKGAFPGAEDSVWEFDKNSREYFRHQFYKGQPDLNIANPQVRQEISKVLSFWLALGVAGFRIDAVPYLVTGTTRRTAKETNELHEYLRAFRLLLGRRGDGILLGEANVPHEEQFAFFGEDRADELTMQFDFVGMQALYLSLARHNADALSTALASRRPMPPDNQWANFIRNHDELTLDKLTKSERADVFAAFGPDPRMQIFGRGLRRRLPSMLDGDQRRIRLAYALLFSMPGTPVLYYGEEIGMAENLDAEGRQAVRTPMQWSGTEANGGFSPARHLIADVVQGDYGAEKVNVEDQRNDPRSLFNFFVRLFALYRECPELGWSTAHVIEQPDHRVLALLSEWEGHSMITVHNFTQEPCEARIAVHNVPANTALLDLMDGTHVTTDRGRAAIDLQPYESRWLRILRPDDRRLRPQHSA
jgi:trehalose synthase